MRQIIFHEETKTFHLYNEKISYILCVLENGHLGQLYFGKRLHDKADFSYLVEKCGRPMTSYIYEWDRTFSLEHIRQEYPVYGTTDYRHPAIELLQENGSRISEFQYESYEIIAGKPKLSGLPATYTESEEEAQTLRIFLKDALTGAKLALLYTIFDEYSAIARSAYIENAGEKNLHVLNMMSLSLDLPDKDYEWMQLSGAWSRERYIKNRTLEQGITAIDSMRGNSSHEHNPFLALKRHNTDENAGNNPLTDNENTAENKNTGNDLAAEAGAGKQAAKALVLNFTDTSSLTWPVRGNVILDYSMDQTTYFPTLDQYKLSPAIAVGAVEGAPVVAAVNGKVYSIEQNAQTGTTLTMELGNGYQAVYGQLTDLTVSEGDTIKKGTTIGYIAQPTKYYSTEGTNLYFAMKKDGEPIDPIEYLP